MQEFKTQKSRFDSEARRAKLNFFSFSYLTIIILLFFYSFTQVDLGLTLNQWSVWQVLQKFFQNIGYFNRSLSTIIYLIIIILMFIYYFVFLFLASKKRIKVGEIWKIIIITSGILTFSYNAFSYDLFNYIFDAKIVTFYHQNPYFYKALDFPGDPMLAFMHWTHRIYPYGPTWLGLTIPVSFLGFRLFLLTFFLFKILIMLLFIGSVYYIGRISRKLSPENEAFNLVFFAMNPLVIIESLVSSHNDIVTIFFLLLSIYLLMNNKYFRSILMFFVSIGVKLTSVLLIPVMLIIIYLKTRKKTISWELMILISTIIMGVAIVLASFRTNFQPWYLLFFLPLSSLISKKYFIFIPSVVLSFFALLQYAPFLYLGNWDKPVPEILNYLNIIPIFFSVIIVFILFLSKKRF